MLRPVTAHWEGRGIVSRASGLGGTGPKGGGGGERDWTGPKVQVGWESHCEGLKGREGVEVSYFGGKWGRTERAYIEISIELDFQRNICLAQLEKHTHCPL